MSKSQSNITTDITGIYSAITLEGKVKQINDEVESKYSKLLREKLDTNQDRQNKHLQNYGELKTKLQSSSRGKRSIPSTPTLTQDQRTSLGKIYSLYSSLKEASRELALKFRDNVPNFDLPVALPQEGGSSSKRIEKSLKTIRWTDKAIRTQLQIRKKGFFREDSWGPWNSNPFKPFYENEEQFKADIRTLQSNAMGAHKLLQVLEREQRPAINRFWDPKLRATLERQYKEKQQQIASLQSSQDSHIVNRVASYLLKAMSQLQ